MTAAKKNIRIAYFLGFLKNSWFWLGIWVFYYLRYTNYAGIGIIETVLIATMTISEIPTGAIADLLGKKKTLTLSFLLEAVGGFLMAFAPNFPVLCFSVFVMCIGGTLYSGTMEALIYDSLLEVKENHHYGKVIANIGTIQLISPAVCSIIGGFIYSLNPSLPFIANSVCYTIGFFLTFLLTEPLIDTEKFSLAVFVKQTKQGFKQLTKTLEIKRQVILLLSVATIIVIADEMLNGLLAVEFGFNEKQVGILWSAIYIVSALASQLTPRIKKEFGGNVSLLIIGFLTALSFLVSPFLGIMIGGISLTLRASFQAVYMNLTSIAINENTESKYRATTLSTFNMIKNTPYLLLAYFIGFLADSYSAKIVAMILGIFLGGIVLLQSLKAKVRK